MFNTKMYEFLGYSLNDCTTKDVGIEIEVEGTTNPFPSAPANWASHTDGSLKALYSKEYVSKPLFIGGVEKELLKLKTKLGNYKATIMESVRAGVHVHVNVLNLDLQQTLNVAYTYLAMEKVLVKFCGSDREGNLFCLRASDAEYLIHLIHKSITEGNLAYLNTDSIRYSSLNMSSLFKHGTLEFRAMKTEPDLSKIQEWAEMLCKIREYGSTLESPVKLAEDISLLGPELWIKNILGDKLYEFVKCDEIEDYVMEDLRNIQYLLYA